ncbi:Multicopper oxidase with three cupredoxin domains (includes cell division protein FtsP and spore coat protein CotA) [Bradyrhizobium lablabi]|uniref:Multicopper oxidase with three cupredoxin domains (Includes cell division protein FtsP and spore coat protein CotA) n=2 Tax=Bradyrhizobium lablabi TaxID=722472 RepID=A0A1M7EPA9_9BRAD|nr:Multicopper oxidase with three cupredoxin domains (includes cell division protein FtsP and spore coat protein CotA) [Bradyrhizobium lablabi]
MGPPLRSKKMVILEPSGKYLRRLDITTGKWSASVMADRIIRLDRRELVAGLGLALLCPALPGIAAPGGRPPLALQAKAGAIGLRPGASETPIWLLQGTAPGPDPRFKRGDALEVTLLNDLPVPAVLNWHGINGVPAAEPLLARTPLLPGAKETLVVPMRHAGTLLCDLRLLGDSPARPSRARAMVVGETEAVSVDRDEVLLIEDWRLRPDGTAIAPGIDPKDAATIYTINGLASLDIPVRSHERLRIRLINGCQRNVIAIKIEGHEVRIMALDGQPAEPFPARNGAVVLAPGARTDAFVDATVPAGGASSILLHDGKEARPIARLVASKEPPIRDTALPEAPPLPSNGLPAQLELKNALRFELSLGGPQADWMTPANFAPSSAPAFHARTGRTVVLALANRADKPTVFHLHGHHFRLLDRLDDGWKPFWLDTLAIDSGQTQRIAFLAEYAGRWLIEAASTDWAAPRVLRWYNVE